MAGAGMGAAVGVHPAMLPLIGPLPGTRGAYVATGHSVWGMLNAPATGEAIAELILDGTTRHVPLRHFAPGRLKAFAGPLSKQEIEDLAAWFSSQKSGLHFQR